MCQTCDTVDMCQTCDTADLCQTCDTAEVCNFKRLSQSKCLTHTEIVAKCKLNIALVLVYCSMSLCGIISESCDLCHTAD